MNTILKIIAKNGLYDEYITTTSDISKEIHLSQQSTSRILIEMQDKELIIKKSSRNGTQIKLTNKGIKVLEEEYTILKNIFMQKNKLTCKVTHGIGEGKFYVELYSNKIKDLLGYKPYLGTLNLHANPIDIKSFIHNKKSMKIESFKDKKRTYGQVTIIPVKISNLKCAILLPLRTTHADNIIEIIYSKNLKRELNIKLNSTILVEI